VELPLPYYYNRFSVQIIGKDVLLAVFRKHVLELLVLDSEFQLKKSIVADEERKEEEEGWVQLGEGGFMNANATHHVLVNGTGRHVTFYRILAVEDSYEVVKVSEVLAEEPLLSGRFVSNNILLLQDHHNLYLANVGDQPHPLQPLETYKFSYLDFFIDEEGLEVDKKLLLSSLVDLLGDNQQGDQKFVALEGKRLTIGNIYSWESILEKLVYEKEWERALLCFENIYNSSFKLCCKVNENLSERNKEMQPLCQSITSGYLLAHLPALQADPQA
jgi:hypothetical protein